MDNLEKLLKDATPRPWMVPHLTCDDVTCNCRYVVAEYGGMGSIATISVAESDKYPWGDDKGPDIESAKANARLIAMAPDLAAEVLRLREALESIDAVAVDFGHFESAARTMKEIAHEALFEAA